MSFVLLHLTNSKVTNQYITIIEGSALMLARYILIRLLNVYSLLKENYNFHCIFQVQVQDLIHFMKVYLSFDID